ncbi:preprotein translocase subunit SecE [Candidatus Saccharibacteria bacterium]|nr:preprotein translocase subunit SecE [Candidatus Saccharibacteria bacterium]
MANVTRIKAKDDAPKKEKTKEKVVKAAEEESTPIRKVSVKAKGTQNKKVIKSKLEQQAERDLENRARDKAEKAAIKAEYKAKRDEIKKQLKKIKKSTPKDEKKAIKKKVKEDLKAAKIEHRDKYPGYFRGAFREIRQVRWPNRKETWKLTFAVIGYVLIAAVCLMLLDMLLKYLFNTIIGGNM